jgi:hypothetical protein
MKKANKAARSKMEMLGKQIVGLDGESREEAMKVTENFVLPHQKNRCT